MATLRPSTYPLSRRPCRKMRKRAAYKSGVSVPSNPITGIAGCCCARPARGHAAAMPPSSVMNRLRRRSSIRQPLPWYRCWSVYRTVSLLRRAQQVLGVDLNYSEIRGLMSALGQNRTLGGCLGRVRLTPESGHQPGGLGMSALCHKRTLALAWRERVKGVADGDPLNVFRALSSAALLCGCAHSELCLADGATGLTSSRNSG